MASDAPSHPSLLTLFTDDVLAKADAAYPLRVLVVGDGDLSYAMVLTESLSTHITRG
jgi:hypothetical protein